MSNAALMAMMETIHELTEEVSSSWFLKSTIVGDEIKELTPESQFKHNELFLLLLAIRVFVDVSTKLQLLDNILMPGQVLHGFDFIHEQLLDSFVHIIMHQLNGNLAACLSVEAKLDLATGSLSECS